MKINDINKIVYFHRRQSGLSRNALARLAGVGKTVIYDIENGKETVKLNTLLKVLSVLNIILVPESPLMEKYNKENLDE